MPKASGLDHFGEFPRGYLAASEPVIGAATLNSRALTRARGCPDHTTLPCSAAFFLASRSVRACNVCWKPHRAGRQERCCRRKWRVQLRMRDSGVAARIFHPPKTWKRQCTASAADTWDGLLMKPCVNWIPFSACHLRVYSMPLWWFDELCLPFFNLKFKPSAFNKNLPCLGKILRKLFLETQFF